MCVLLGLVVRLVRRVDGSCTLGDNMLNRRLITAVFVTLPLVGCGHECHDVIEGSQQALRDPAPADGWHMPKNVADIAATMSLEYAGAPAWNGGANCSGGMRSGSHVVSAYVQQHFPGVDHVGGYNCRQIRNGTSMSIHGTGRALDIMIPVLPDGGANNAVGDPIANWLVVNAERLGIHLIIWDQASWGPHRDHYNTALYSNPGYPHKDHLHIELTESAASETSEWFKDGGLNEPPYSSPFSASFTEMDGTDGLGAPIEGQAGDTVTVRFAFENTGSEPWVPGEVQLAVVSPTRDAEAPEFRAPTWINSSRLGTVTSRTEPGQVGIFDFDVTVPTEGGLHDLYVSPVYDNGTSATWFGGVGGPYDHHGVYLLIDSRGGGRAVNAGAHFDGTYSGELEGGCSVGPGSHSAWLLSLALVTLVRRRRR